LRYALKATKNIKKSTEKLNPLYRNTPYDL